MSDAMPMQLYVDALFTSPWAMSVHVALQEKGLPFTLEKVDLDGGANQRGPFAALSVTRRVPTLVHGDFVLSESTAITEYLEALYPTPPLYPTEPRARARVRQLQSWVRSDLQALRAERSTDVIFYGARGAALSAAATAAAQKLFTVVDRLLADGAEHVLGDWTLADPDLALMLKRLIAHGDAVPPRLVEYAERQWQRPSVQAWVALSHWAAE